MRNHYAIKKFVVFLYLVCFEKPTVVDMKDYLFRKNLSVKQLASDLEISPSYLYQLIRGERKPSLDLAQKIEIITGGDVTVGRLLGLNKQAPDYFTLHEQYHQKMIHVEESIVEIHEKIEQFESRISKLEEHE